MTSNERRETAGGPDRLPMLPGRLRGQALTDARHQSSTELKASETEAPDEAADLFSYWRVLVKRRWTVLGALAIVLVAVLVGTLLMTPIHRASTTLQIDRDTVKVVDFAGMAPIEDIGGRDFYQTKYELLQSRSLALRAVSKLDIPRNEDRDKILPIAPWTRLTSWFKGENQVHDSEVDDVDATPEDERGLVEGFRSGLTIEPVRNSRLVRIHYDSPDPAFAQRAANAVAEAFIASNLDHRLNASSYAKEYLEDRLQELKLKLEESERQLVAFAQKEQIVSTGETGTLSEQTLGSFNAALAKAREDRIRAESRWQQAQSSRGLLLYGDIGSNSILGVLQESRARLMADYQDKLGLFKASYPLMLQLKAQIDEVDQQIAGEIGNIKSAIQAEYRAALQQETLLSEQLTGATADVLDLQHRSIQYNIYRREVDTNRQLYDGLLQRYKEIGIAGGVSTNNISVVDSAGIGERYKPSLSRNLAVGAIVALMLGVLLALGLEYLDDTLKTPEDVEKQLGLAMLGVIPRLKAITPAQALEDPRSAFAESYRSVRTALQFSTDRGVPCCLLVTSPTPNEGKSTTAMVLAQNFALLGKHVLLIDCDLRNPSLHRQLGISNAIGLTNLLAGTARPDDIAVATATPNMVLIPTGPLPPNPAELLMGSRMLSLLTVAMQKYDQIILDAPPVIGLADAPILASIAHGTLLVVEAGGTRITVARNSLKRLALSRAHVIGAVMTKFDARQSGYGYSYGDYSYYAHADAGPMKLPRQ